MTSRPRLSEVEAFVESPDQRRLFLRAWRPGSVRAVVAVVHAPGSGSARYRFFAEALAEHRIATYAIDLRGCGGSSGSRARSLNDHLLDIQSMMSRIKQCEPDTPVFLLGHGTSAVVACHHALQHAAELEGVIGEATLLDAPWRVSLWRKFRRLVHALRLPRTALFRPDQRGCEALGGLSLPLLLLHGSEDRVAPPSDSECLHRCVSARDKTLQVFEGFDHELINGRGHALVREKIVQWIEEQLGSSHHRRRIGIEYINP